MPKFTLLQVEESGTATPYTTSATTLGELKESNFRSDFSVSDRAEILVNGGVHSDAYQLRENDVISTRTAPSSKS